MLGIGPYLLAIIVLSAAWLGLSPWVPLPSSLLPERLAVYLPPLSLALAVWMIAAPLRRMAGRAEVENTMLEESLAEVRRMISDR